MKNEIKFNNNAKVSVNGWFAISTNVKAEDIKNPGYGEMFGMWKSFKPSDPIWEYGTELEDDPQDLLADTNATLISGRDLKLLYNLLADPKVPAFVGAHDDISLKFESDIEDDTYYLWYIENWVKGTTVEDVEDKIQETQI